MTLVEFSISPLGKSESVSRWVARAVDIIDRSGLSYQLGPMGTCIEGEWDQISRVIGRCLRAVARDCGRVSFSIKADHRRGRESRLERKVEAVVRAIGRPIRTAPRRIR